MFARLFLAHPRSVDESYLAHARFAMWFSGRLFLAAGAALVHALLPLLFEKTAGRMIRQMAARLEHR